MVYNNFFYLQENINSNKKHINLDFDTLLDDDMEVQVFKDGIGINRDNLVIDGGNTMINAKDLSRIFKVTGRNVILKNMRLECGHSKKGGVIYNKGHLVLENCILKFNSGQMAGAIFNKGHLRINNCILASNTAQIGGAIVNKGNLFIKRCRFSDNNAKNGSSIVNYGELEEKECSFRGTGDYLNEIVHASTAMDKIRDKFKSSNRKQEKDNHSLDVIKELAAKFHWN